jgi:hypothetical protein
MGRSKVEPFERRVEHPLGRGLNGHGAQLRRHHFEPPEAFKAQTVQHGDKAGYVEPGQASAVEFAKPCPFSYG